MKLLGALVRAIVVAGAILSVAAMPATAASDDMATLAKYMGTWVGKGAMNGNQKQPVTCKMALTKGNGTKLNYTGRCSIAGAQISVTGTIAYVEEKRHFEAIMNSGIGGFTGVAVGQRSGERITFDLQKRADDNEGNDISVNSRVVLTGNDIVVEFHAVFNSTGDKVDVSIPFART